MNSPKSPASTSDGSPVSLLRRTFPATAATWGTTALMAPFAWWNYSTPGALVVAAAGMVITLAAWSAAWLERSLVAGGQTVAGLLAPSAVRMILPLAFALFIAKWDGSNWSSQIVLYLVPLYLAMLAVETVFAVGHQDQLSWPAAGSSKSVKSVTFK